jgi:hypothetical protein
MHSFSGKVIQQLAFFMDVDPRLYGSCLYRPNTAFVQDSAIEPPVLAKHCASGFLKPPTL